MKAIFLTCVLAVAAVHASEWNYEDTDILHGPGHWGETCEKGQEQSPIDIEKREAKWTGFKKIQFSPGYKECQNFVLINNGHTIQISLNDKATSDMYFTSPSIDGTNTKYYFGQLHCHWKSEHAFNGKLQELECHAVHYREGSESITDAVTNVQDGALAIFGLFYNGGTGGFPFNKAEALRPITKNIDKVTKSDDKNYVHIPECIRISDFLPLTQLSSTDVYRYNGSLTTPACNEGMHWFVFDTVMTIEKDQIAKFYELQDSHAHSMTVNHRPLQPLNQRTIQRQTLFQQESVYFSQVEGFMNHLGHLFG